MDWSSNAMIAIYLAAGVVVVGAIALLVGGRSLRSRRQMDRQLRMDPDIHEWLVTFNWTSKVLYAPTICASVIAAVLMFLQEHGVLPSLPATTVGGVWVAILVINFFIEEYQITLKWLAIVALAVAVLLLWLHLLGWTLAFLKLFRHLAVHISGTGYLLVAILGSLTILVSWIQGLFHYVAITPNTLNIQHGAAESGELIGREDFATRIDTSDFLERLLGFGRIVITFKDATRLPMTLLVWNIGR